MHTKHWIFDTQPYLTWWVQSAHCTCSDFSPARPHPTPNNPSALFLSKSPPPTSIAKRQSQLLAQWIPPIQFLFRLRMRKLVYNGSMLKNAGPYEITALFFVGMQPKQDLINWCIDLWDELCISGPGPECNLSFPDLILWRCNFQSKFKMEPT